MSFLQEAAIYLVAAVILVPITRRLGLGSILGYLVAGAIIGPSATKLVGNVEDVLHFSEIGVVFFLFLVGLELEPKRLWAMRRSVFGLGNAQVLLSAALLAGAMFALGVPFTTALIGGLGLSLSSTAIALQLIGDRGEIQTPHGRASFAILLFQDIAVIPILALVPLLAGGEGAAFDPVAILKVVVVVVALIVGSRVVLRPAFRMIAASKSQEIFTAAALLVVLGTAMAVGAVGLSMSLGAFLAGVMLADSEYRHELEADIEPFKGLLLGLFFIAVGMSVNLGLFVARPFAILGAVLALLVLKAGVVYALGRFVKFEKQASRTIALALAQGGEFAFVLFGVASRAGIMPVEVADFLVVVVSVSMAATPLVMPLFAKFIEPLLAAREEEREFDKLPDEESSVIIAGFGRYGQIVARVLGMAGIRFTALEKDSEQVDFVRKYGNKIYFGDASRLDLLRAAKADKARAFVLAIDEIDASVRTAAMVREHFPDLPIYARARNRNHVFQLMDHDVTQVQREAYLSSLQTAQDVLVQVGLEPEHAATVVAKFREFDESMILRQYEVHDDEAKVIQAARSVPEQLRAIFEEDADRRLAQKTPSTEPEHPGM